MFNMRSSVRVVWGSWMFGFGAPLGDTLWALAFGPVRVLFFKAHHRPYLSE